MGEINTIQKYEAVLEEFAVAVEEDKEVVRQIFKLLEAEKMSVCRAKIVLTYVYNLIEIHSDITIKDKDYIES